VKDKTLQLALEDGAAKPRQPDPLAVETARDGGATHGSGGTLAGDREGGTDAPRLGPGAVLDGWRRLQTLEQPFTVSAAREALDGTRRVALAVLARLDAAGGTVLLDDGTRHVVPDWSTAVEPARTRSFVSEPGQDGRHGH